MNERILLLEDDPVLGEGLVLQLQLASFNVRWCKTVREGLDAVNELDGTSLALLDVSLPDGTGFEVARAIQDRSRSLPVIFLTARTDEDSVIQGFQAGAKDYIRKPFGKRELLARIQNLIPGASDSREGWSFGGATLLKAQRKLLYNDLEVSFNRREYEILRCFFQSPEAVLTRERLVSEIDRDGEIFDRTIDSHISHVRTKLRKAGVLGIRIDSVYGEGYKLGQG